MNLLNEVRITIDRNREETVDICKKEAIYKPHLRLLVLMRQEQGIIEDPSMSDIDQCLVMDKMFFERHLKDIKINSDRILTHLAEVHKSKWYLRLPSWLDIPRMLVVADKEYNDQVRMDVQTPYFELEQIPSLSTVISHVQPSNYHVEDVLTPFGEVKTTVKITPPLDLSQILSIFHTVSTLKCEYTKEPIGNQGLSLSQEELNFIQDGTIPENISVLRELATIATSATPYTASLYFFLRRFKALDDIDAYQLISYKSQCMDKDAKAAIMVREKNKTFLTSRQIKNALKKLCAHYTFAADIDQKALFAQDYEMFNTLRFHNKPYEALLEYHRETDYLTEALKRQAA
ncbi:MAG: hypothetical protein CMF37_15555 [Leeuwenhoekiella sp.]|nr:hypothetical protein [Leeuwenhoekiella sp.]MBH14329.1 hypothetical protein [Leeuwenhoekiella sp.]MBQ50163.1 hypothetical protein [Leeuwenhoekiella sp.]MBQ50360.1 hypothetical protein [Leeuwenhoekiella sp.]MBQ50557.1 hypothetical protein [Leeuwenhoekiella sp.]|tara:strand:- start:10075 stop:11112 length:1038 start_codon:yes stop_codon:yes gene_type:complete